MRPRTGSICEPSRVVAKGTLFRSFVERNRILNEPLRPRPGIEPVLECCMHRRIRLATTAGVLFLADLAHGAGSDLAATYRDVLHHDGRILVERMQTRAALLRSPAAGLRARALVDSISSHVVCAQPQVVTDHQDSSHRVEIAASSRLDFRDAFTYAFWVHLDTPSMIRETKIVSHAGVAAGKVTIMGDGRRIVVLIRFQDGSRIHLRTTSEIGVSVWTHVAVSYERTHGPRIDLDGHPVPVRVLAGDLEPRGPVVSLPGQPLYVGGFDRTFPGKIDDLRVYDRALSAAESRRLSRGMPIETGLVAHWSFDDAGDVAHDAGPGALHGRIGTAVRAGQPGRLGTCMLFARDAARWTRELRRLETDLEDSCASPSRPSGQPPPVGSVPDLLAQLSSRGVRLVHFEDRSETLVRAWVLLPDAASPVRVCDLRLSPSWLAAERSLRGALQAREPVPEALFRQMSRAVAADLWDPLESMLGSPGEVWLRMSPSLREVAFAALVDHEGRFLCERWAFAHCGPVRWIGRRASDATPAGDSIHVLAVANPSFHTLRGGPIEGEPSRAADAARDVTTAATCTILGPPLFGAQREVEAIARLVARTDHGSTRIHEWGSAHEEAVLEVAATTSVLHVATHGYRLAVDCLPAPPRDPLLLSGVVLAGAMRLVPEGSRGSREGLLAAAELAWLDLSRVRLVVWSGCATARGEPIAGEPMSGLAAASWLAGAPASVATLWPVADEMMPVQIEAFYEGWLQGASAARSLQAAQRAGLEAARQRFGQAHPGSWAALVVEGI